MTGNNHRTFDTKYIQNHIQTIVQKPVTISDQFTEKVVIILLMGHSAAGKDTFISQIPQLPRIVRTTTREAREGETNKIDYFFKNDDTFGNKDDYYCFEKHPSGKLYGIEKKHTQEQIEMAQKINIPLISIAGQVTQELIDVFADKNMSIIVPFFYCDPTIMIQRLFDRHKDLQTPAQQVITDINARLQGAEKDFAAGKNIEQYLAETDKGTFVRIDTGDTANTPQYLAEKIIPNTSLVLSSSPIPGQK